MDVVSLRVLALCVCGPAVGLAGRGVQHRRGSGDEGDCPQNAAVAAVRRAESESAPRTRSPQLGGEVVIMRTLKTMAVVMALVAAAAAQVLETTRAQACRR